MTENEVERLLVVEATTPNLMASRLRMSRKQIKILLSPRIKNLP